MDQDAEEAFNNQDRQNAWFDLEDHCKRYQRHPIRPKTFKTVINRVMAKKGYGQQQSNNALEACWRVILPNNMEKQTRLGQIRRGTLEVFVADSATLQQLSFLQHKLVKQLKLDLPTANIRNLRFKLGELN